MPPVSPANAQRQWMRAARRLGHRRGEHVVDRLEVGTGQVGIDCHSSAIGPGARQDRSRRMSASASRFGAAHAGAPTAA